MVTGRYEGAPDTPPWGWKTVFESLAPFFKHVVASPHSVVTAHLMDEAGPPAIAARDEILAFFARRLAP